MTEAFLPANPAEARDCTRHPGLCFVCPYHADELTDCKGRSIFGRVAGLVGEKKHPGRIAELGKRNAQFGKLGGRPRKPDSELKRPRRRPKAGEATPAAAPVIALEMRQEPAGDGTPEL